MTSEDRARDLLECLNLPDDAPEVLSNPKYWNVAFCRRYLECCETMRFEHPEAGLRVAEVAPGLALLVPRHQCGGDRGWCSLQLDALGVRGSAHRTVGDLDFAEQVFHLAALLFTDDADEIACARLMRRTAYLRAAQCRFMEAEELAEEAIEIYSALGTNGLLGCALVDRGVIYGRHRRFQLAARDLLEALDYLVAERDSRYYYSAVHNLARALLKMENADPRQALRWLDRAEKLNRDPAESVSRAKLLWMKGEAWALLGRFGEARSALGLASRRLLERGARLDSALAAVELAEVCFREGDLAEVCRLAGKLFPLFQELKSDRDAYDALKLFHNAALAQALTVEIFEAVKVVLEDRSWGRAVG